LRLRGSGFAPRDEISPPRRKLAGFAPFPPAAAAWAADTGPTPPTREVRLAYCPRRKLMQFASVDKGE